VQPLNHRSARIAFQTASGLPFSMWRCLIGGEREQLFGFHNKVSKIHVLRGFLRTQDQDGLGSTSVCLYPSTVTVYVQYNIQALGGGRRIDQ
jgi:hypothetical protein